MPLPETFARRAVIAAGLLLPVAARAQDARLGERAIGNPDAPVTVTEYFSLTCSHCAAFSKDVYPKIKAELIDTGKVRFVFRDFPLDRLALTAAAVARALPADRYEGFVKTLLATQDRWAFTRGDQMAALASTAALAGMPRSQFDQVVADEAFQRAIFEQRAIAEKEGEVRATPSFTFAGRGGKGRAKNVSGGMSFEQFKQYVDEAAKG
jgi:protein-disulfide isomerase